MSHNSQFLARVLKTGARTFAAYTASELIETQTESNQDFGPEPFSAWQNWLAVRVEELAAAVAAEQPSLFVSQVRWAKTAAAARGVPPDRFRDGLTVLRRVLGKELPPQVQPLAGQYLDEALGAFDEQPADISKRLLPDDANGHLASNYLLALLEGDRRRASSLILEAADGPETIRALYLRVLFPAQGEIGRMWLTGEINVAEEHFASHTTKMVMGQLLSRAALRPPNGKTMLAAAVAGNQHDIGLYAVADFFEMDGWRTIQLGADVPAGDLVQAVGSFEAHLLAISACLSVQLETVKSTIQAVRNGPRGDVVKILAGGLAFAGSQDLAAEMGADGYAADPEQAVSLGCRLVGLPPNREPN